MKIMMEPMVMMLLRVTTMPTMMRMMLIMMDGEGPRDMAPDKVVSQTAAEGLVFLC